MTRQKIMIHPLRWPVVVGLALLLVAEALAQSKMDITGDAHADAALVKSESAAVTARRLAWWSEARFGMFIHWGLYAQDGCFYKGTNGLSEHMMRHLQIPLAEYAKIATEFNPTNFDAAEWVRIAKSAGMKYLVITAKHHDGFAMFDSASSDYNIVKRTPWGRDPVKELAAACRAGGLKFGVYYSLGRDWEDPDATTSAGRRSNTWDFPEEERKDFARYFERKVKPQVRELLTQYGPIAVVWFDTPELISKAQSEELVRLIRQLQPDCLINQRVGNRLGDFRVAEQEIPAGGYPQAWETCMTLNKHWGYFKGDDNWKSADVAIRNLVDIASKGGNYLLNVGPTGQGEIEPPAVDILEKVGAWLKVNGESIHGTTRSPLRTQPAWGRVTKNGSRLYLHVFYWPTDGRLVIEGLPAEAKEAWLLALPEQKLKVQTAEGGAKAVIEVPGRAPDAAATVILLKLGNPPRERG